MARPAWWESVARMTPTVAGASLLAVAGLAVAREAIPAAALAGSADAVGNYLQTLGGIYAVLLAFVVFVVWGQFNDLRGLTDREAAAVVDLHRTASLLPPPSRREVQAALRAYCDAVLREEWTALARGDEGALDRIGARLEAVWTALHRCRPVGDAQTSAYGEVLSRFNDLNDLRTNRLSAARARVPLTMRILLYIGAVVTVGSMYLMTFARLWLHATVTAALAGSIAHILFLIADLDDPFGGCVFISHEPFERARMSCARDEHLADHDG